MEYLKSSFSVTTRLKECINPDKCICIFCKRLREEKKLLNEFNNLKQERRDILGEYFKMHKKNI